MVKGHPAYSGTIMTATFQIVRELGWEYLEKLSTQRVHAGAVVDRPTEETCARRARRDGRRQTNTASCCSRKPASRSSRSTRAKVRRRSRARPEYSSARRIPTRNGCFSMAAHPRDPAISSPISPHNIRACAGAIETGPAQDFRPQADEGRPAGVEKMTEEIKTRYAKAVSGVIVHRCHSGMVRRTRPGISRFRVRASRAPE